MIDSLVLLAAAILDILFAEPPNRFHPTAWLGKGIQGWVALAPTQGRVRQLAYGFLLALSAIALFSMGGLVILWALTKTNPWLHLLGSIGVLKATFAVRALGDASAGVQGALEKGRPSEAMPFLSSLVRRDAAVLSPTLMASAAVESLAENTADSFIGPWFYFALFGVAGALAYRAINTLDSMLGYHGKYEYLGKASARLDDLASFLPARISALLILLSSPLARGSIVKGWTSMRKYHSATESPNAGWTMSAMAGALGVTLEKPGYYRLGEDSPPPDSDAIRRARRIMYAVAATGLLLVSLLIAVRYALG